MVGKILKIANKSNLLKINQILGWHRVFFGARIRILTWYIVLMTFFIILTILGIRHNLLINLEERVEESLVQEVEEFQSLVKGQNPNTGEPFDKDIQAIFNVFLFRNIPDDDEFLITIFKNKIYKSSPSALPNYISQDSELVKYWANLRKEELHQTSINTNTVFYKAYPIEIDGEFLGVFVVANTMVGEREEIDEALGIVTQVAIAVLGVASFIAWLGAGKVLSPLRLLTKTARSITESDLTGRIPVRGNDEIAELAIAFNHMLDRLQAGFISQGNFLNDAGHELRTPITIIQGNLELMGDGIAERQETMDLVFDELARMNRLVSDLLVLAKTEQPNFLHLEIVDISVLTQELFSKARVLGARNWCLDGIGYGLLLMDRQRLTQAVLNLAQNATQHTSEEDTIAIGSSVSLDSVRFWVRDTGEGIPLDLQSRIFERFVRGEKRRCGEGSGLGLSIVRAIAQSHGGQVELISQVGKGSTFTILIPIKLP